MSFNQQNPGLSRKIGFLFFGITDFSIAFCIYFTENLNPIARKFAFLGRFEVESSQIKVFKKTHFEVELSWKLDFKTSQLQNVIQKQIWNRSGPNFGQKTQDGTANEKKVSPTYAWALAKASRIVFYNEWRLIFKSTRSSVQHDKWQDLAIFENRLF